MLSLGLLTAASTALLLSVLTTTVKAGEFLQPFTSGSTKDYSDNVNYAVGVGIITQWEADFSNATVTLNQDNNPGDAQGGPSRVLEEGYDKSTWGWTVSFEGMDPAYNNVFYLSVSQADGSDSFTSHYFNISESPKTSTLSTASTASSMPSATTSTTSTSSASTTSQPASPATVTVAPPQDGGTPTGTIAGMVVGIVVGILVLVAGAWWAWKAKRRRHTGPMAQPPASNVGHLYPYTHAEPKPYEVDGVQVHELHALGNRQVHELHNSAGDPRR
ncbi:MAG: hypothetical protein Q9222_001611 [Ikaeria aurantiellina]